MWFNAPQKRGLEDGNEQDKVSGWVVDQLTEIALTPKQPISKKKHKKQEISLPILNVNAPWELLRTHCEKHASAVSFACLSFLYEHGLDVDKNVVKAIEYKVQAANAGHGPSALALGQEASSEMERFTWYKIAATNGCVEARYQLGKCYMKGIGCNKDEKEAFGCFVLCSDIHAKALYRRASILVNEKKWREAYELFQQAATKGDSRGYYRMALLLEQGQLQATVVERSRQFGYLQLAAEANVKNANGHLGKNYLFGEKYNGFQYEQNDQLAVYWYEREGNARAKFRLGKCYKTGQFYPINPSKAFALITEAANENDYLALCELSHLFVSGYKCALDDGKQDLPADPKEAFRYRVLATQHPETTGEAWTNLGWAYHSGIGTEINVLEALKSWQVAATRFHDYDAKKALREYHEREARKYS